MKNLLLPFIASLLVSACCSPGVKPENANVFQAACGLSSGDFDKQTVALKQERQKSAQVLDVEEQRKQALKAQSALGQAELQMLRRDLTSLDVENSQLQRHINALNASTAAQIDLKHRQQHALNDLKAKTQTLKLRLQAGHVKSSEKEQLQKLQKEIEILRKVLLSQ